MSRLAPIQPTLQTILTDRLREGRQPVGEGRNVAEVLQDTRQREIRLGEDSRSIREWILEDRTQEALATPPLPEDEEETLPPLPPPVDAPQYVVPTPNGIETQFFTGQQLDRLV